MHYLYSNILKIILTFFLFTFSILFSAQNIVYSIPIKGDIDMGLPYFIERIINEAEDKQASYIIFIIDTFGGRIDAATKIKDAILNCKIPTIQSINQKNLSLLLSFRNMVDEIRWDHQKINLAHE